MKWIVTNMVKAVALTFWAIAGQAADKRYPVSDIPEELKAGVHAVVRNNQMVYTIQSKNKANLRRVYAITILDGNGSRNAKLVLGYDKLTRIPLLTAVVFDAEGNVIRRLKPAEIYDAAAQDGFSLYSDARLKAIDLTQSRYPYTVEFTYEVDYKYLYSIPDWIIANDKNAVQHSSYTLTYPIDIPPRYRVLNWNVVPTKDQNGSKEESLHWTFDNIKPITLEPHGPHPEELLPRIIAAPSIFEYDGYTGNMSSWKEYGQWNAILNQGRDVLPEATRLKVRELTRSISTTEEKAKVLYEYLQSKSRYVSIQLGIGGLQTFPASVVDEVGYGDCKALSNYMVAMLKEVGIRGYYTIIQAGDGESDLILDFPSHQSNHVIVAVPDGQDTLWMECTSQTRAFGYMGRFTGDRTAFMITEEGGVLVRTPRYTAEQNIQFRTADVTIDAQGNAKATVKTTYTGTQTENGGLDEIQASISDDQRKWVQSNTEIPNFNIRSFSINGQKDKIPSTRVHLNLDLPRLASVSGKRLFVTPNLMNRSTYVPEQVQDRKTEVVRHNAYTDVDTINILLPESLYPEFIPQAAKLTTRFGEYEVSYAFEEGKIVYIRKMKMLNGRFPKESYNELIDFYKSINKYDNLKLVLLNKT